MIRTVIICRWCGRPVGPPLYEVFDHVDCTTLEVTTPPEPPLAAVDLSAAERKQRAWQLEKQLNRIGRQLQRWQR
jgi:hypothetical protein